MISATITFIRASADWSIVPNSEYEFYYDTLSIGEAAAVVLVKAEADGYQVTDVAIVHANKGLGHAISFADSLARSVEYSRQFTSSFALDDTAETDKDINANKGNIAQISDVLLYDFGRPLNTTMDGFTDVLVNHFNKPETDDFGFSDSLARVVVWSRGFGHSFGFTETTALSHNKVLASAFGMDSATLVNKNYTGTKGNVFTFSEQVAISRTHGKALGNMMLGTLTLN